MWGGCEGPKAKFRALPPENTGLADACCSEVDLLLEDASMHFEGLNRVRIFN